jgi:hypothetical protein
LATHLEGGCFKRWRDVKQQEPPIPMVLSSKPEVSSVIVALPQGA